MTPGIQAFEAITASSVQFSSAAQSCLTLCDPMNCSTPGLPVHHSLMSVVNYLFNALMSRT